jgi:lipoprotein-releasing system permease protein
MVQVVVMGVLDGMLEDYRVRISGLGEQVSVFLPHGLNTSSNYKKIESEIKTLPFIKGMSAKVENYAIVSSGYIRHPVIVSGIDIDVEKSLGSLDSYILDQSQASWKDKKSPVNDYPSVIIGYQLAQALQIDYPEIEKGAIVAFEFAQEGNDKLVRQKFRVVSRFRSGIGYYDQYMAFVPLKAAQALFSPNGDVVTRCAIWLNKPDTTGEELNSITGAIRELSNSALDNKASVYITTAEDSWQNVFAAMAHENALMEIVMALISIACGFAIFAVMYTLVSARIRDIGILRSIGAGRGAIMLVFILSGAIIGVLGAIPGALGGVAISPYIDDIYKYITGTPLYPPHLFGAKELHINLDVAKIIIRTGAAVLISILATLPAAIWAATRSPLEALRHE